MAQVRGVRWFSASISEMSVTNQHLPKGPTLSLVLGRWERVRNLQLGTIFLIQFVLEILNNLLNHFG